MPLNLPVDLVITHPRAFNQVTPDVDAASDLEKTCGRRLASVHRAIAF